MSKLKDLIFTMMKIGIIGFGGGNALIPIIEKSVVEDKALVSSEELEEDILIANITPGALPVEVAGGIGKRVSGNWGMFLSAAAMAFPGVCLTLLLLSAMSQLDETVLLQIEYLTVGITAFIACLLTHYITNTIKTAKSNKESVGCAWVIIAVFLLTCGKNFYRIMENQQTPWLSLAAIDIFAMAFFVILYTRCRFHKGKLFVAGILCVLYILDMGKCDIISSDIISWLIKLVMVLLALYGIVQDVNQGKNEVMISWKTLCSGLGILILVVGIALIPACMVTGQSLAYVAYTILSSLMSFGGGDAYLTVADGLFVGNEVITEEIFYGNIVPAVNILPGSILCKTVSGIGYYLGYEVTGNHVMGLLTALAGFVASVAASCGVFHAMGCVYKSFENLDIFKGIKKWIRPIVSGLMLTVILSLAYQNCKLGISVYADRMPLIYMIIIYIIDLFLFYKVKVKSGVAVMVSALLSFFLCNIFM